MLAFGVVAGGNMPREIRVFAVGALSGATVGIGDYVVDGMLDRGDREALAAARQNEPGIDWIGRMAGFATLAWFAWQWFGKRKAER